VGRVVSIASARDEIRRRRKLRPIGDPLAGPWKALSTGGTYVHEMHLDPAGAVVCSTCRGKYGRGRCWATARVVESLGLAPDAAPEPEPAVGSLSWRDVAREAGTDPCTKQPTTTGQHALVVNTQGGPTEMQTTRIESLLVALGLPIPAGIKGAIENRDKGPDPAEVATRVKERVAQGAAFDLAARQVQRGKHDDLKRLVEVSILSSASELLDLKRSATLALFAEFRALGDGIPTTATVALYAGPELQAKYKQRQEMAERYGRLHRLHWLLLEDPQPPSPAVNPTAWLYFGDTRAWPPSAGTRSASMAFGEHDKPFAEALPVRLEFLAGHADFWQPDAQECNDYYLAWCLESRAPKVPPPPLSATVKTVRV
jgi:hypothetical protein